MAPLLFLLIVIALLVTLSIGVTMIIDLIYYGGKPNHGWSVFHSYPHRRRKSTHN